MSEHCLASEVRATAFTEAEIAFSSISVGGSGDMFDGITLERGLSLFIDSVSKHRSLGGEVASFNSAKKMRGDFTPDTDVDKVLRNDPQKTKKLILRLKKELSYWRESVIPKLGKTGRLETFIKTWMLRINRAAVGVDFEVPMSPAEILYCKIDMVKDILLTKSFSLQQKQSTPLKPVTEETVIVCSTLHYKLWSMYMKRGKNPVGAGKFNPLFDLINFWEKIILSWYGEYLHNAERDSKLAFVGLGKGSSTAVHHLDKVCRCANGNFIHYPKETVRDKRSLDYSIKLYLELVLSPHIHLEWKLDMARYLSTKGISTIEHAFLEEEDLPMGAAYAFQPCAARFWDFCKSEKPPSSIKFAIITPEPSSCPCVSSGAGLFGHLTETRGGDCAAAPVAPSNVIATSTGVPRPTTRRWIEEGSVLMFNMYPLTITGAPVGHGRRILTNWSSRTAFVSHVMGSLVSSRKRIRNAFDKGSRSSDLLSEGSWLPIKTVVFNCKTDLETIAGNRLFDKVLSFEGDILGGTLKEQHMKANGCLANSFPSLVSCFSPSAETTTPERGML